MAREQSKDASDKANAEPSFNNEFLTTDRQGSIPATITAIATSIETRYLPTEEAYAHWASIYDTDGNFLQATDDMQLETMLPQFLRSAGVRLRDNPDQTEDPAPPRKNIIDLGCGTGRNTIKVADLVNPEHAGVIGLDSSVEMLIVAWDKKNFQGSAACFQRFDINDPERDMREHLPHVKLWRGPTNATDVVISTLVLEHIELKRFFSVVARQLNMREGGYFLVTNMHSDMGRISQAGFVDENGVKVRPKSIPHTIEDVCNVAKKSGFDVIDIVEKQIDLQDVPRLGQRSKKWVGINCWFGITFRFRHL